MNNRRVALASGNKLGASQPSAEMTELDLKNGQEVSFLEYDADSGSPLIEWVDGIGIDRITTVDPALFDPDPLPGGMMMTP